MVHSKKILTLVGALCLVACEKPVTALDDSDANAEDGVDINYPETRTKKFTFTCKGNFNVATGNMRAATYLTADENTLTDLYVLDYMDHALVQQVHQVSTDADWGVPVLNLKYGTHHIYFIGTRSESPTLDTDLGIISWEKPRDTFYKDYEVTVTNTSNGNRAVTMDRCVTLLRVTINDVIPDNMATLSVTPKKWYYGWNYLLGCPAAETTDRTRAVTVPESKHGAAGLSATFYGMSTSEEWSTDVIVKALDGDDNQLGQTTITAAPFRANRYTELSGMLLTQETPVTLSVNADWLESYEDTF